MWNALKIIKKFTPKAELDKIIGAPRFQIEDRPMYYYGKGFAVYYSPNASELKEYSESSMVCQENMPLDYTTFQRSMH